MAHRKLIFGECVVGIVSSVSPLLAGESGTLMCYPDNLMRKARSGEITCTCSAYRFPHRFGGGRCHGMQLVSETWEQNYGGGECANCHMVDTTEGIPTCQVLEGREKPTHCQAFEEFIQQNELKLVGPYWAGSKL